MTAKKSKVGSCCSWRNNSQQGKANARRIRGSVTHPAEVAAQGSVKLFAEDKPTLEAWLPSRHRSRETGVCSALGASRLKV